MGIIINFALRNHSTMKFKILNLFLCLVLMTPYLVSCNKDEPVKMPESEQNNDRNNGNSNQPEDPSQDSDDESEQEEDNEILGKWSNDTATIVFEFKENGTFTALGDKSLGFKTDGISNVDGLYTYSSFKKFLWLSVNGENNVYMLEYRCLIDGETMALYRENSSRAIRLSRVR